MKRILVLAALHDCFILPSPALVCPSRPCAFTSPSCAGDGSSCCCPGRGIGRHGGCRRCWSCSCTCCRSSSSCRLLLPKQPTLLQQPLLWQKLPMLPKHLLVLLMARHWLRTTMRRSMEGRLVHQSEIGLVPAAQAAQSATLQRQRMDIAESVGQAVGSTFGLRMEGLLLGQEEIKHHAVAGTHAPAIFNAVYDTSKDFSWAMFGFNTMVLSFFPGADKNTMSMSVGTLMWISLKLSISIWTNKVFNFHICWTFSQNAHLIEDRFCPAFAHAWGLTLQPSEANIVEEARDLLQLIPPHNSIPKKFSVAARHHVVKEDFSGHGSAFHVMGGAKNIRNCYRGNFNPPVFHCPCWVGCHCAWAPPAVLRGRSLRWWSASVQHLHLTLLYERCCQGIPASWARGGGGALKFENKALKTSLNWSMNYMLVANYLAFCC